MEERDEENESDRKELEEEMKERNEEDENERKKREAEMEERRKQEEIERKKREAEMEERRKQEEIERKKREEEMEKRRKEEEDIIQNPQRGRKDILRTLDKEKLRKIVKECPKRTSLSLNNFCAHLKKVTSNLTEEEKAYTLFYWMSQNIAYDVDGYFKGIYRVQPEETYTNGCSVCSGFSRLFKYIGTSIGLSVICVVGYAKGVGFKEGMKITGTNHEWNIIKFGKVLYQIDSTWGQGVLNGRKNEKKLQEFYFCPEPEQFFPSHYPEEPKWQLIYPSLSVEEFSKRAKFYPRFYDIFDKTENIYVTIKAKSKHTIRFYKKNKNDKLIGSNSVYDEKGNKTNDSLCSVLYDKDYIDFFYIFKKKGRYKTNLFAGYSSTLSCIVTYFLDCEENWPKGTPFNLPTIYDNDIIIIEPIVCNFKKGDKVTLKMKSDVTDEIIVINNDWLTIKKNKDGIFETTITVKTNEVVIGKKTSQGGIDYSIAYNIK